MIGGDASFLQMFGFPIFDATGVSWYLSSLYLVMILLMPYIATQKEKASLPLAALGLFLLGSLSANGVETANRLDKIGPFFSGNIIALGDMCLGVVAYYVVRFLKERSWSKGIGLVYSSIELLLIAFSTAFCFTNTMPSVHEIQGYKYYMPLLFFLLIVIVMSERSAHSHLINSTHDSLASKLSISIFLSHCKCYLPILALFPTAGSYKKISCIFGLAMLLSATNLGAVALYKKVKRSLAVRVQSG